MNGTDRTAAALDALAAYGPFFACGSHDPARAPREPWRSLGELVEEPAVFAARVAAVRAFLAAGAGRAPEDVELRVAASVTHLGLVARIVSPVLALAALHDLCAAQDLDRMRWQPVLGGMFPLSLPRDAAAGPVPGDDPVGAAARRLTEGPLTRLVEAASALSVSRQVLWGNVASAVHGAAAALAAVRPASGARVRAAAEVFLRQPALSGTHAFDGAAGAFRRRSCCLIYRAAAGGPRAVCGDCVLAVPAR